MSVDAMSAAAAERTGPGMLAREYFLAQAQRPADLVELDAGELQPDLRMLLLTDGTVTRTLEALLLRRIRVRVLDERPGRTSAEMAPHMGAAAGEPAIVRHVVIGVDDPRLEPVVCAESLIVPSRLPECFQELLATQPHGIGEAIAAAELETRRELLWFGLAGVPSWARIGSVVPPMLSRTYRVQVGGVAALIITELFHIQRQRAGYGLRLPGDAVLAA